MKTALIYIVGLIFLVWLASLALDAADQEQIRRERMCAPQIAAAKRDNDLGKIGIPYAAGRPGEERPAEHKTIETENHMENITTEQTSQAEPLTVDTIRDLMRRVHETRQAAASAKGDVTLSMEAWTAENRPLIDAENAANLAKIAAEADLRNATIDYYNAVDAAPDCGGVSVRLMTKLHYEYQDALAWAKEHKMALIPESLDQKVFESLCKASKPDFVQEFKEPQATIATDLSKFVDAQPTCTKCETRFPASELDDDGLCVECAK